MKIEGYAPDLDPTTPGILTDCANFVPTLRGYEGAPAAQSIGVDALAAACVGAAVVNKLDDTTRLFAGTSTKLYELSGTSWTDRSRAGDYTAGTDIRWCFTQFGDVSLAVHKTDVLQYSTTGAFADLTAPKATICETVGQFVFLFDTNEATYGDSPNRWWCCAKGDYTNWVPSVPNECATGLLTSTAGPIKAGKRLGDNIVAYKENAIFVGTYGGAAIWDFREVPGNAGALGQYAVVNVGTADNPLHIFMGRDDFYQFDGSRPVRLGAPVRETVYTEMNRAYAYLSVALHDPVKGRIFFYYCSTNATTPDKCVVYNYRTGKWGRDNRSIEMPIQYVNPGVTYTSLGSSYSTYSDLPNVAYDSSFWTSKIQIPAVFDTAHTLKTLNGASTSSYMTTGDMGDDQMFSLLTRVNPRFITKPTSATMTNYYRNASGDSLSTDQTVTMSESRFDVIREARWHRLQFNYTGPVELNTFNPALEVTGAE